MNVIILEIHGDIFIIPARKSSEVVIRVLEPVPQIEPTYHLHRVNGMDGWMGGWMDGWLDGSLDGWMDS